VDRRGVRACPEIDRIFKTDRRVLFSASLSLSRSAAFISNAFWNRRCYAAGPFVIRQSISHSSAIWRSGEGIVGFWQRNGNNGITPSIAKHFKSVASAISPRSLTIYTRVENEFSSRQALALGVGAALQRWILAGEQSLLLTHIAAKVNASLCG